MPKSGAWNWDLPGQTSLSHATGNHFIKFYSLKQRNGEYPELCNEWANKYKVKAGQTWGKLPSGHQRWWKVLDCGGGEARAVNNARRLRTDAMVKGAGGKLERLPISKEQWARIESVEAKSTPIGPVSRIDRIAIDRGPYKGSFWFAQWSHPATTMWTFDDKEVGFWGSMLKPGTVAIDIGANCGDTTMPIAHALQGIVLAFEVHPSPYGPLAANAALNPDLNIVPFQFAINDKDHGDFLFQSQCEGCNGGQTTSASSSQGVLKFKSRQLLALIQDEFAGPSGKGDHSLSDQLVTQISLIKMDAEGYDHLVLKSIKPLLELRKKLTPGEMPLIFVEWFNQFKNKACTAGAGTKTLFDAIEEVGYEAFPRDAAQRFAKGEELKPLTCASPWEADLLLRAKAVSR